MRKRLTQAEALRARPVPLRLPERPALKKLNAKHAKRNPKTLKAEETDYQREYRLLGALIPLLKHDPMRAMYQTADFQSRREQLKRLMALPT
jgi:hypothetical protein